MTTRIVEGQLPYSGGTGIGIDTNKVISVLLREEDNLIHVNGDNELYTDLQLAVNITPSSDFPVGVTVGKVLAENGWSQNGLILNWKTTSGDYARWLYGADGKIYFDGGQGTWVQVYYSSEVDALFTALRGELATVAFTGDYNDLRNRPQFLQVQADWNQTDSGEPDYIKNKPTIPTVNDATLTIQKNGTAVATFTANSSTNATANITVPSVIDNVTSTSTSDALSANQGKALQDQINDLKAMGRFLSLWDCETGQPISFPLDIPYNYQTGDYYLVENVDTTTNYRPSGVQYTGSASTTPETDEVEVGDMYIYDGQIWLLQINHGKTVSFANLSGQPSDNANLASALNAKANVADLATVATTGDYDDLTNKPTIPAAQVNSDWNANSGVAQILNKPTIPTDTNQLTNGAGYITSAYHDSSKQDVLVSGTNIKTVNNNSLLGNGDLSIAEVPSGGTNGQVLTQTSQGPAWQNATGGADIEYKTQAEYNALLPGALTDNKHYFIYTSSVVPTRLPAEYQEVEYIQSSGNGTNAGQYIDPDISISNGTVLGMEIDFEWLDNTTSDRIIFGSYYWTPSVQVGFGGGDFQNNFFGFSDVSYTWSPNIYGYNTRYLFTATATSNYDFQRKPRIFAQNEGANYGYHCISAKLYSCKINKDNALIRDLVPCYRKQDNEIGLYDLVNDQFYINQGSGVFTKGPDAN